LGEPKISANNEFPKARNDCDITGGCPFDYYGSEEVDDWFKRCVEDKPKITLLNHHRHIPSHEYWDYWFEKWFGQFKEETT